MQWKQKVNFRRAKNQIKLTKFLSKITPACYIWVSYVLTGPQTQYKSYTHIKEETNFLNTTNTNTTITTTTTIIINYHQPPRYCLSLLILFLPAYLFKLIVNNFIYYTLHLLTFPRNGLENYDDVNVKTEKQEKDFHFLY